MTSYIAEKFQDVAACDENVQGERSQWWKFTGTPIRDPGYANNCTSTCGDSIVSGAENGAESGSKWCRAVILPLALRSRAAAGLRSAWGDDATERAASCHPTPLRLCDVWMPSHTQRMIKTALMATEIMLSTKSCNCKLVASVRPSVGQRLLRRRVWCYILLIRRELTGVIHAYMYSRYLRIQS